MDKDKQLEKCNKCGRCIAVCVADKAGLTSFPSYVNKQQGSAFNCAFCWRCVDECPLELDLYEAMIFVRRRDESKPLSYTKMTANIRETGRALQHSARTDALREKLGLAKIEEIPKPLLKIIFNKK